MVKPKQGRRLAAILDLGIETTTAVDLIKKAMYRHRKMEDRATPCWKPSST
jgi:hypothetical protein